MSQKIQIECIDKLGVFIQKKKKLKILVGGRGSTKSTFVADYVLSQIATGKTWCCGREFQNSIEESVHALLIEEIDRCGFEHFSASKTDITHESGGRAFYRGLARNIASIKSVLTDGMWIEEGETLSKKTLDVLTASIRVSAGKAKKAKNTGIIEVPEIWITMNRGNSKDAISQKMLKRAEPELKRTGYYEDEYMMIMQVNYPDMPKSWFIGSGLEEERASDELNMSSAEYKHKWLGEYSDTVENAIILPEWFDACVDAHKTLGFEAVGQEKVAYDPADCGDDPEALAYMHGVIVKEAKSADEKSIDLATDWACSFANSVKADVFVWDCDGMGVGLKRQVSDAFRGKKVTTEQFKGGHEPFNPSEMYQHVEGDTRKAGTNKSTFANQRAQCYWILRDRMFRTWLAVKKGKYISPDELISFSNDIMHIDLLRSEICSVPRKFVGSGRIQLLTKPEMLKLDISSPNIADCIMMMMKPVDIDYKPIKLTMSGWG